MTSPNTSSFTSSFSQSGNLTIDSLLTEVFQKWGGGLGTEANLSFSFPWANGNNAYWQTNYSSYHEPDATFHYGFNATQMQAARNALQAWGNVANLNFTEVADTSTNVGDFRFGFSSAVDDFGAWGWCGYPNNYWASGADVWIDTTYSSDSNWSAGSYNYEALAHEIGHGLGLKHPGDYAVGGGGTPGPYLPPILDYRDYTIMSYNNPVKSYYWDGSGSSSIVNPETPMVGDIQAIQYLYGANTSYHTGGDIYTFNPNDPFYKTIWDAGGIDTIDVSNFSLGCSIDLTPGSYSKVGYAVPTWSTETYWYDGSNALGIAFGAIIENAVGGTGNDILTGNAANNVLKGGVGDDTVIFSGNLANAIISYLSNTHSFTITTALGGTDVVYESEYFQFADQVVQASALVTNDDTISPTIVSFSPADGATGVSTTANIVVTFSEAIQRGTGAIGLWNVSSGSFIETFDVATSNRLTASGSTLTIDPTSTLLNDTNYYVTLGYGNIKDLAGNAYAGIATYDFTTVAPAVIDDYPWSTSTNGVVVINGPATSGIIETAGDGDMFKVTLTAGATYVFDLVRTGLSDPYLELYSPAFALIKSDDDGGDYQDSRISYAATTSGTYYLGAKDLGTATGAYALSARDTGGDATAPILNSLSPADNATGVAASTNLVLTFNEAMLAGGSSVIIFNADGTVAKTINITDTSQVSISGSTVTLNPSTDLAAGSSYSVNLETGVLKDLAGNSFAGITYNFTTANSDTNAPILNSLSPADNATGVAASANLVLTFNEAMLAGVGNVIIYNANGTVAKTLAVTDTSQVSISGSTVTLNPSTDLVAGSSYYLNLAAGVLKDLAGNSFAGISGTSAYNFTTANSLDTTVPLLNSLSPADNATGVDASANLVLTFNEAMLAGVGNVIIYNTNGSVAKTINVTDTSQVSISGSSVTINPTTDLAAGSSYYINLAAGVLKDLAGNSFAGISGTSAYNFTTAATVPLSKQDDFVVLQFSSPAVVGAGAGNDTYLLSPSLLPAGLYLTLSDTQGSNSLQLANGLAIASSNLASNALQLTLDNGSIINVFGANAFTYDVGGNSTAGINQADVSFASFALNTLGVALPTGNGVVSGGAVVIGGGNLVDLVEGTSGTVSATASADVFAFSVADAKALVANTQININGFSVANDQLQIDTATALGPIKLNALNGVDGISVQTNVITSTTLINFGVDANADVISLSLVGVLEQSLVNVNVI